MKRGMRRVWKQDIRSRKMKRKKHPMPENPLPLLTTDWKVIRNVSDAIYEAVDNAVQVLVDEYDLPDDEDSIEALTERVYRLATTGQDN